MYDPPRNPNLPPQFQPLAPKVLPKHGEGPAQGMQYAKGQFFLEHLERLFGRERFDPFIMAYFQAFAWQSITTETFLDYLDEHLLSTYPGIYTRAQAGEWLYEPGVPADFQPPVSATLAAAFKRRLTLAVIETTVRRSLGITCMFMWIILAALCFGAVFDGLGAVRAIESVFLDQFGLTPWQILVMMQLSYILLGMFLDDTAMLVIVAPLYVPLVITLGFDPIWYGVLYTITVQIAYMTPPFGYNLFLMRAMAPPEISLGDIYRSVWPFVAIMLAGLALITAFPELALWLPGLFRDY